MDEELARAISELGGGCREVFALRADFRARYDELETRWVEMWDDEFADLDDDDYAELEAALRACFRTGVGDVPDDLIEEVQAALPEVLAELREPAERLAAAEAGLDEPKAAVAQHMRNWLDRARGDDREVAEWQTVLSSWRRATGRTTRDAADVLGVSSSAVVRWEQGKRRPSIPQIAGIVEALAKGPALPEETEDRIAARRVAKMLGSDDDTGAAIIESFERPIEEMRADLEEAIGTLSPEHLQVLARLVGEPQALSVLAAWADSGQLATIAAALTAEREVRA